MPRSGKYWAGSLLALAFWSCSPDNSGAACVDGDPRCGLACNTLHPCAAGLYCGAESLCAKECSPQRGCRPDQHCGEDGRCKRGAPAESPEPVAKPEPNEPRAGGGSIDNPGALADAGVQLDAAHTPAGTCQSADVSASRVIPTVVFVIDQSKSMEDAFGSMGGNRWTVLRDFLLKPDGLIASLQSQMRFGLAMYSADANGGNGNPTCPLVTDVTAALDNFEEIRLAYGQALPLGETPTGDSIDKVVAALPKPAPDQEPSPTVLILATDGEPDRCEELNPQNGQLEAISAVENAFKQNIRTFIISVGDEVSIEHQQAMANAGVGHKAGEPNAPYWNADDDGSLRDALNEIVSAQVSCDVALKGKVAGGNPCDGSVLLNGVKLTCNGDDGWKLTDPTHIQLVGKACADFRTMKTAMVHASFPCTVQVVF
jgi:hypothetical protein